MPAPPAVGAALRVGAAAAGNPRWLIWLLVAIFGLPLALAGIFVALIAGLAGQDVAAVDGYGPSPAALADIPAKYLQLYQAAGAKYGLDWMYIAAIGKVETNHGRLKALGVTFGVNAYGCCAGPMQFSIIGPGDGTWGAYRVDGDHDGKKNVYDPDDAIPSAGALLKDSGAPEDWDRAIFAYNHASWYVEKVKRIAESYRGPTLTAGVPAGSSNSQRLPDGGPWLVKVPGTTAICDRRIVPDVELLLKRYKMTAGDCFAMSGHKGAGEHPLGLGIDLHPGKGGSWKLLDKAARDLGWRISCGQSGCAGQLPSPFRFIGWNNYPGHGDPAHVGADAAHLHLSWQHTPAKPGTPAQIVQTMLAPAGDAGKGSGGKGGDGDGDGPSAKTAKRSLLNLGDSLAVGTAAPLTNRLAGWRVRTDAQTSRSTATGVARLRAHAQTGPLPDVVAISLGTNDTPTAPARFARHITSVMALAGARRCVLWFSISRPPLDGVSYAALNRALAAATTKHANLQVLDGHAGQFAGDSVHKTPAGYNTRARLIATAAKRCAR